MPAPFASRASLFQALAILSCLGLLAGCNLAPVYAQPTVQTPMAFKEQPPQQARPSEDWKPAQPRDAMARGRWWEMFQDPDLDALEAQVAVGNQSLAAASPISRPRGPW